MQYLIDRAVEGSKSSFLTELFQTFNSKGIDYAVARDYPTLPEGLEGRDLDIVVGSGELERAYKAVRAVAKVFSAFVLRIEQEYSLFLLVIHSHYSWALRIDLNLPNSNTWRGCSFIRLESALQNKVSDRGIEKLPDEDIFLMQYCKDLVGRFHLREKYHSPIRKLYFADSLRFEKKLREIFGGRFAARLLEICRQGNFYGLKRIGKQMRRAVMMRAFIREPALTARNMVRYVYWRCREYVNPNGLMVAVVGADGAESETLVASVRRDISKLLQYQVRTYRSSRAGNSRRSGNEGSQFAKGIFFNTLRLFYHILDYIVAYWFVIRHWLGRKNIMAIFDGRLYDYLVSPTRFLFCLPEWMVHLFAVFLPKPDLVIILSANADTIKKRKPGLTSQEIRRQVDVMEKFTRRFDNFVAIDTSGDIKISKRAMRRAILQKLKKHLK